MLLAWRTKEKSANTSCPRLGLEVPDVLLPDVGEKEREGEKERRGEKETLRREGEKERM